MLAVIIKIALCSFAVLGFVDLLIYVMNLISFRNTKAVCKLLIASCPDENAEYTIRFYEGLLCRTGAELAIKSVVVGSAVSISDDKLDELSREYGNLEREK